MTYARSMVPKTFEITPDKRLKEISFASLEAGWQADGKHRWLALGQGNDQVKQELLVSLDIDQYIEQVGIVFGAGSRFDVFSNSLYIEFPMLHGENNDQVTQVSIVCLPTTILTIHDHPVAVKYIIENYTSGLRRLQEGTTSGLLYSILDQFSAYLAQSINPAKAQARRLTTSLEQDPDSVTDGDIMVLKEYADELVDVLEDITYCVTRLGTVDSKAFNANSLGACLRDLSVTLLNGQHSAERFERRLSNLHLRYTLIQQEKMNNRLQALTIISAIFLPLTLLVGIYGMNFERMPELKMTYGYPAILILMVLIVLGLLYVFKIKGWFK